MIALTQDTNAPLSSLRTKPLNGFKLKHRILLKSVVSLITNLLMSVVDMKNSIHLVKSNTNFTKHDIYNKERNI